MTASKIVTFYSYKGGVGRTAALANVAWILASNGHRVCVVDWDLEAPGLHRYFAPFLADRELTATDGLIDFLIDYVSQAMTPSPERSDDWWMPFADLSNYAVPVTWNKFPGNGSLDLVVAGRQGPSYAAKVNSFDWQTFYERFGGGAFLDEVRRRLRDEYDYVLIDSRTGVSDTAGICTAQLPDQLVACFMYNLQSIEGTAAVAESAVRLREITPLQVLPVPMRVELAEKERHDRARVFARDRFRGLLHHLPPHEHNRYWSDLQVIYQPYYAYEEVLATFADPTGDRLTVLSAYENLCGQITDGAVTRLRPPPEAERARVLEAYRERFGVDTTPSAEHEPGTPQNTVSGDNVIGTDVGANTIEERVPLWAVPRAVLFGVLVTLIAAVAVVAVALRGNSDPAGLLAVAAAVIGTSAALAAASATSVALSRRLKRLETARRYRQAMRHQLRYVDLKGLPTTGFYTPQLRDVGLELSVVAAPPHETSSGVLAPGHDRSYAYQLTDFIGRPEPAVVAVIGGPGSGKSTLLRLTALLACEGDFPNRPVPVLLNLRDLVSTLPRFSAMTLSEIASAASFTSAESPPGEWFERQLRIGNCLVLLDGLDEVVDNQMRRRVVEWIETQTRRYPSNDFVVTSRPLGYLPVQGALVLQLRNFSDQQVARFVRNWYRSLAEREGMPAEESAQRAEADADDLLQRLTSTPELASLTSSPLLLTMIVNVHRFRGALPGSTRDLYREIFEVMLWRRNEAKNLPEGLSGAKKSQLLQHVAYMMTLRRIDSIPAAELVALVAGQIRGMSRSFSPEDFIVSVTADGVLVEQSEGAYAFFHSSAREYGAAEDIRERRDARILVESVDDPWWRETTLFYADRSDASEIVRACLASASEAALSLAVECVNRGTEIDPALLRQLESALAQSP